MKVRIIKGHQREILLTLMPSKNILPIKLIENALKMLQEAFGIIVSYSIFSSSMDVGLKAEIVPAPKAQERDDDKSNFLNSEISLSILFCRNKHLSKH